MKWPYGHPRSRSDKFAKENWKKEGTFLADVCELCCVQMSKIMCGLGVSLYIRFVSCLEAFHPQHFQ